MVLSSSVMVLSAGMLIPDLMKQIFGKFSFSVKDRSVKAFISLPLPCVRIILSCLFKIHKKKNHCLLSS